MKPVGKQQHIQILINTNAFNADGICYRFGRLIFERLTTKPRFTTSVSVWAKEKDGEFRLVRNLRQESDGS